ncbi:chymotrypsin-1-like [Photinus pyralis]|uniref:chymotrypsin-1-like n=1 Tax=Photinus pyralis TaxID=7054 RepID=UPI00126711D7|nr:chymotrypsin-1-like [Photinus pyralis]
MRYAIVAGVTHLAERGIVHQVARIILSDEIKDDNIFDLAILKVAKPFIFNKLVAPIPLDMNGTGGGVTCIASGWGITRQNGSVSHDLLFTDVKTITNEECVKLQPYPSRRIYKSHLCTSTAQGKGVCEGDSGGPLACDGVLSGLTSWGWPCARGPPDCFFRISLFIEYIKFYMDQ